MLQLDPVPLIPEISLIDSIAVHAHVDSLKPRVECLQPLAPGVLVANAIAKRKRISGAEKADLIAWNGEANSVRVTKALGIRADRHTRPLQIWKVFLRRG